MSQCKIERKFLCWTINNLCNHPGGEIDSVIFGAGNPRHSLWYIKLFVNVSKEGHQALSHKLVFLRGSYERGYTYRLCVMGEDDKTKPLPLFNPRIKNCNFLERTFFNGGSVTLHGQLSFQKKPSEHMAYVKDVSTRIGSLREMEEFSDLVLAVGDEEFHVHRFLFGQRCPKLLGHLGINDEVRAKLNIPRPVLKALLRYIYSGKPKNIAEEYVNKFCEIAEVCEFEEFTKEIFHANEKAIISTDIRVIRKNIFWDVSVQDAVSGKVPLLKLVHLDSTVFLVKASIKRLGRRLFVQIIICCRSSLEEPILLNCITSVAMDKAHLKPQYEETHPEVRLQFSHGDKDIQKLLKYAVNEKWQNVSSLQIVLNIALSRGENTCLVEDVELELKPRLKPGRLSPDPVFGMALLSLDLKALCYPYTSKASPCDFKVNFKSSELDAHRAVLAASSPVLHSMLSLSVAQRSSSIYLDVDRRCGGRLVWYLYSGEVSSHGCESDLKFFEALNVYQVSNYSCEFTKLFVSNLKQSDELVRLLKQRLAVREV